MIHVYLAAFLSGFIVSIVSSVAMAAPAHRETDAVSNLYQRSLSLSVDTSTAAQAMANNGATQAQSGHLPDALAHLELICMQRLLSATDSVQDQLHALMVSVALSELAVAGPDRKAADEYSRITNGAAIDAVARARMSANGAAADCSRSAIVNQRAQTVLDFLSDTQSELDRLSLRLGPSRYR